MHKYTSHRTRERKTVFRFDGFFFFACDVLEKRQLIFESFTMSSEWQDKLFRINQPTKVLFEVKRIRVRERLQQQQGQQNVRSDTMLKSSASFKHATKCLFNSL